MKTKHLSEEGKLFIANSGGTFEETGNHSWRGKGIRKGKKLGRVIKDENGMYRILTVLFEDGSEEKITMNNIGISPKSVEQYEWKCGDKWYQFSR